MRGGEGKHCNTQNTITTQQVLARRAAFYLHKVHTKMFRNTFQSGFLSILYSIGSRPLQIWEKNVKNGHIKRITDQVWWARKIVFFLDVFIGFNPRNGCRTVWLRSTPVQPVMYQRYTVTRGICISSQLIVHLEWVLFVVFCFRPLCTLPPPPTSTTSTSQDIQSSVLELLGSNVNTNYITCPADPQKTLGIKLPFLVMIIKNLKVCSE